MTGEQRNDVQRTQVAPIAGVWSCPSCGRRIQVVTDSARPLVQPFVCVCGAAMEPGEEHFEVGHDEATESAAVQRTDEPGGLPP